MHPFSKCLTPELTGAGGPIGPQGTNIGHQNREAMANVGVRVERFVRLGRGVEGLEVAHYLHLLVLHLTCHLNVDKSRANDGHGMIEMCCSSRGDPF
jgi:hypothetical protein